MVQSARDRAARHASSDRRISNSRVCRRARDLRLGANVVGSATVREPDGLALSSRNAYLTPEQRRDAVALSRGLFAARELWDRGERDPRVLRERVRELASNDNVALEYVSVADPLTLAELDTAAAAVISLRRLWQFRYRHVLLV